MRRAYRDEHGAFLVEGAVLAGEALEAGAGVRELFVSEDARDARAVTELASSHGVEVVTVPPRVSAALSDTATPQGIVAVVDAPSHELGNIVAESLVLVLAGVGDPGNAGTLVRSAAAAGAGGVVFTAGSVDAFNPKAVRAAAGALWTIPIVRAVPLESCLGALRCAGHSIVGADSGSGRPVYDCDLSGRTTLVVGNEARGLSGLAVAALDGTVVVPMRGAVESLNVAVAGSILLFEAARQRRGPRRSA